MFADIEKCLGLAHPPNFLLALGLCCYTEYWGKLLLGRGKHETKINKAAFNAFLYKLDKNYYQSLAKLLAKNRLDIYFNIRCGLAHAYLIEEGKTATIDTGDKGQHGIEYDHENRRYTFWVKVYFEEFKNAVNSYIRGMEPGTEDFTKLVKALSNRPVLV